VSRFVPGHNVRGGRSAGSRNKLQVGFLRDLSEAWERDGVAALRIMCKEEPSKFVAVCAQLMPREVSVEVGGPLAEMSDEELQAALQSIRQLRVSAINGTAIDISEPAGKALKVISKPTT
jgi:hypothetical protein